jgi:branched-chain amino acid transport system permease protein
LIEFLQYVIDGLGSGTLYVLVAIGFTLVFGVMGLMNAAHADFYMLAAFGLFLLGGAEGLGWGVPAATIAVLIGSVIVGFAMFHLVLKRLDKEVMIAFFVATLGVSFFLENLVAKLADFRVRSVPSLFTAHTYVIGGLYITNSVVVSLAAALIITFGLLAFLKYTENGQLLRAVAENATLAKGVGINTGRMTLLAVLIGSSIAVIGGLLYANTTSTADPFVANTVSLKMFAVAIVAGIGSVGGALGVGLVLGIAESLTLWVGVRGGFDGSQWQNVIGLVLMVIVLMTRPNGLFGKFERIG